GGGTSRWCASSGWRARRPTAAMPANQRPSSATRWPEPAARYRKLSAPRPCSPPDTWPRKSGRSACAHPDRGRVAGQLEALAGIGDLGAVDLQDRKILIEVIADQQIFPVGRERRPFRQSAQLDLADLADLLAVDAQHRGVAVALVEIG